MVREQLYDRGVRDSRVLEAMLLVPRHIFLDHDAGSEAYADHSFPIGFAQTMSQPHMVGYLCEELRLTGRERVLEIGTGSGYQAAVLATLAEEVCTVERVPMLAERALRALQNGLFPNVAVRTGDGAQGWEEKAPFDRVLLTAAASQVPRSLLMQLKDGGFLLGPVEKEDGTQRIVRLTRQGTTFSVERLRECSFVPLVRDIPSVRMGETVSHGETHVR